MSRSRTRWLGRAALVAAVLLPAACLSLGGVSSPDTWWHLAAGEWILEHGEIPRTDPFTYASADAEWIDLHWAFQLALRGLEGVAGLAGVAAARAAIVAATLGLLLFRFGRGAGLHAAAPCVLLLAVAGNHRWLARPDVVSHALLVGMLVLLMEPRKRRVWWILPLQLLWVNLQGTFVLGIVMVASFLAGELLLRVGWVSRLFEREPDAAATRRLAWLGVGVVGVAPLNPYGFAGALYPLELWTRISGEHAIYAAHIAEFMSPFALGPGSPVVWAWGALALVSLAGLAVARGRIPPGLVLVWLAFGFLSVQALRNLPLFGFAAVAVAGLAFDRPVGRRVAWVLGGVTVAAGLLLARSTVSNRYFHWLDDPRRFGVAVNELTYPVDAARFVAEQGIEGPIFNDINAGGYVSWLLGPRRAFIDGRLEVHDELLATYSAALHDRRVFDALVEYYGITCTLLSPLLSPGLPLVGQLARDPAWALVYFDASYSVFVRRAAFPAAQVEAWAEAGRALERDFQRRRALGPPPQPAWLRALKAAHVLDDAPEPPYVSGYRVAFFLLIGERARAEEELQIARELESRR
jgi:hypothetical protein